MPEPFVDSSQAAARIAGRGRRTARSIPQLHPPAGHPPASHHVHSMSAWLGVKPLAKHQRAADPLSRSVVRHLAGFESGPWYIVSFLDLVQILAIVYFEQE